MLEKYEEGGHFFVVLKWHTMLHFLCIYLQASPQNDLMFYELSCEFMVPRLKLCVWVK